MCIILEPVKCHVLPVIIIMCTGVLMKVKPFYRAMWWNIKRVSKEKKEYIIELKTPNKWRQFVFLAQHWGRYKPNKNKILCLLIKNKNLMLQKTHQYVSISIPPEFIQFCFWGPDISLKSFILLFLYLSLWFIYVLLFVEQSSIHHDYVAMFLM